MNHSASWPEEARKLLDKFLDEVDRALIHRAISRSERWNIVGELETQVETVVTRRVEAGETLTVALIQSVLDAMDPPESYGEVPTERGGEGRNVRPVVAPREPKTDPLAITAFVFFMMSLVGFATILNARPEPALVTIGGVSLIVACIAGCMSVWRIHHSDGWLHGLPWAFAAACGLPIVAIQLVVWLLLASRFGIVLMIALAVALEIYGSWWLVRFAWQRTVRGYVPRARVAATAASEPTVRGVPMGSVAT